MLFMTETPNNETKPMAAEMLKSRPLIKSDSTPPAMAKGIPANTSRLSSSELNRP